MSYNPSFDRSAIGQYDIDSSTGFISIVQGSNAFILEDEYNELQWQQYQDIADRIRLFGNGYGGGSFNYELSNNTLTINQNLIALYGYVIKINTTTFNISASTHNNYDVIYLEVAFKIIKDNDDIYYNGNVGGDIKITDYTIADNRIKDGNITKPTSYRIQKQYKISYQSNINIQDLHSIDLITANLRCSFNQSNVYDKILTNFIPETNNFKCGYLITEDIGNEYIRIQNGEGGDRSDAIAIPLMYIKRTSGQTITNNDINITIPKIKLGISQETIDEVRNKFIQENARLCNILNELNDYSDTINPFYNAYEMEMDDCYRQYNNNGSVAINVKASYDLPANNPPSVYQITNIGNHKTGNIGAIYGEWNNDNLKIYNLGEEGYIFQTTHFSTINNNIAYLVTPYIYTDVWSGWPTTSFYVNGTQTDISSWDMSKCVCCVQQIKDNIYNMTNNGFCLNIRPSDVEVFSNVQNDLCIQLLIINTSNSNLQVYEHKLDNNNIVDGKYHKIEQNISDIEFVMLSTPYFKNIINPPDITPPEFYITKEKDKYTIETNSIYTENDLYIKALCFKRTF